MKKLISLLLIGLMMTSLCSCGLLGILFEEDPVIDNPDDTTDDTTAEETTKFDISNVTKDDYIGYWEYSDGKILEITEENWFLYDGQGKLIQNGPMEFDEEAAYLMNENGSSGGGKVAFDEEGKLVDSGYTLAKLDKFPFGNSETNYNYLIEGLWYFSEQGRTLEFDLDGDYTYTDEYADEYDGTYTFDGTKITFFEDGSPAMWAEYDVIDDQIFVDGDAGSFYYRSELFGEEYN